jgi:tape measure domain-containing protein
MISSYYAQVGVGIDRGSIGKVTQYLKNIENQFKKFQTNIQKSTKINVALSVDRAAFLKKLKTLFKPGTNRAVKIDVAISAASLNHMRRQVRQALNGLTVNPTINPRVRAPSQGGQGGSGRQSRLTTHNPNSRSGGFSPWHNPMMVGGGLGAFMRYGAFSLPFVAGTFGLNALSNKASTLQNQDMMMDVSVGALGSPGESAQHKKFLNDLGDRLGRTTESMTPFYAQMLSGAKGTDLEPHLQTGFSSLMEFGSVMGLGNEAMKGTIKAFTQMIGKQQIMAEELRGQAAEHLPPVVRMMAEAVTGGDIKKLNKMMEMGQLDPSVHLPMLFKAMRENAQPFMDQYFKTITFWQGKAQKNQEDWVKRFLNSGGTNALVNFYKTWSQVIGDSIPWAEKLGRIFEKASHYFSAMLLAPGEIAAWFNGQAGEGNFMTKLFGDPKESKFLEDYRYMMSQFEIITKATMGNSLVSIDSTKRELEAIGRILGPIMRGLGDLAYIGAMTSQYGTDGLKYASARVLHKNRLDDALSANPMSPEQKELVRAREMNVWDTTNPPPGSVGFMGQAVEQAPLPSLWDATKQRLSDNWQAMWGKAPRNDPSQAQAADGLRNVTIHITQDPLQVNAVVEARTDGDAIKNMMESYYDRRENMIFGNVIANNPMAPQ